MATNAYLSCPVLNDSEIADYLENAAVPCDAHYLDVPQGVALRNRGFWLLSGCAHAHANAFLVSTAADKAFTAAVDDLFDDTPKVFCYFSDSAGAAYIGTHEYDEQGDLCLLSLIEGLYPPMEVAKSKLRLLGRVVAAY